MNCNFLETEYFFTHLSGQWKSNVRDNNDTDPLSWISMPLPMPSNPDADLTEKAVSNSAEQVSDVVESIVEGDIASNISPSRFSNVSTHVDTDNCLANTISAEENSIEAEEREIEEVEVEGLTVTLGDTYFHQGQTEEFHPKETGLLECKPADTSLAVNHGLQIREGSKLTDHSRYQRLVGKLIYLSHTRPDIAYAVGVANQFMHKPQTDHMEATLRICRYLKGTPGHGVLFAKNGHLGIHGYTDADGAGNPNDRKSTAGYFTFVGGNLRVDRDFMVKEIDERD
ncbi:uncharacterized protein LOC121760358 [Salvia splendens]|uniref:uncharacterized protein LOC121760358 n=1 Tax=Salvia splendens TaxID=180675 RepID=UPI001C2654D8|nr:uncharacterized protein LOC121760358 [Salvia splendens]